MEEVNNKLDITEVAVNLNAAAEHENTDCQEENEELLPDYLYIDPGDNDDPLVKIQTTNLQERGYSRQHLIYGQAQIENWMQNNSHP